MAIDVDQFDLDWLRDHASDEYTLSVLQDAVDAASDQNRITTIETNGKSVAYIVPVDVFELYQRWYEGVMSQPVKDAVNFEMGLIELVRKGNGHD